MNLLKKLAISFVLAAFSFGAQAATINQSATGLTGSFTTETFDAGAVGLAANQFSGLSFSSGLYVDSNYSGMYPNMSGNVIANFYPCCTTPTFISFAGTVSGAAFNFVTNPETSTFTAFLGTSMVEQFSGSTGYGGEFYGFSNILFDSIRIDGNTSGNYAYIMDNLQVASAVPEPETYAMLLVGLGLIGFMARRRKDFTV